LDESVENRVHEYLGGAVKGEGGIPLLIGGTADHVHLFVKLRQDKAVSSVLRDIKANTSGWIHREFRELRSFDWQDGFGAFTVSSSHSSALKTCIRRQKIHHRKLTFKDEFIKLLEKHGVEFDRRYLWK
jgi:hypothetical protein